MSEREHVNKVSGEVEKKRSALVIGTEIAALEGMADQLAELGDEEATQQLEEMLEQLNGELSWKQDGILTVMLKAEARQQDRKDIADRLGKMNKTDAGLVDRMRWLLQEMLQRSGRTKQTSNLATVSLVNRAPKLTTVDAEMAFVEEFATKVIAFPVPEAGQMVDYADILEELGFAFECRLAIKLPTAEDEQKLRAALLDAGLPVVETSEVVEHGEASYDVQKTALTALVKQYLEEMEHWRHDCQDLLQPYLDALKLHESGEGPEPEKPELPPQPQPLYPQGLLDFDQEIGLQIRSGK